ncbi:MAG: hypothetical protein WDO24_24905 [Pseudomonadota bacterium]
MARALLTGLVFWGCGRWAVRDAAPEVQIVAGWGAACVALTVWGALLPLSLAIPGAAVVAAGGAGLVLRRPAAGEWRALARIGLLAAPVLLLLAGARPVLIDSFTHWLANAAYLVAQGMFPADARPPDFGIYPAFPYNLQLAAFISALGLERLPAGAMIHANLVLQLALALLLARLVAGLEQAPRAAPGWAVCAAGLLACWWANPGFGPEIGFSDYGDVATGVALAMAGWLALRLLSGLDRRPIALALALAALVDVKQADLVLVVALVASAGLLAVWLRDRATLRRLLLALLPALALYAVWRLYVATHLTGGENEILPLARWRVAELPAILVRIARIWLEKPTFFGILAAALGIGVARWWRGARDPATLALMLLLGCVLLFDLFLLFIYVAHFQGAMSSNAQSYYRLNTELALLLMVGLVLLLRAPVGRWLATSSWRRAVPSLAVIAALALPVGFFERVRFDLRRARSVPWTLAEAVAPRLTPRDRLAILATGTNHDGPLQLRGYLGLLAPTLDAQALRFEPNDVIAALPARGFDRLLVTCAGAVQADLPRDAAGLFAWDGTRWQMLEVWPLATRPGALFGERHPGELFGCG